MNHVGNEDKDESSEDFGSVNGTATGYEAQNPAICMMIKTVVMMIMMMILTT